MAKFDESQAKSAGDGVRSDHRDLHLPSPATINIPLFAASTARRGARRSLRDRRTDPPLRKPIPNADKKIPGSAAVGLVPTNVSETTRATLGTRQTIQMAQRFLTVVRRVSDGLRNFA